MPSAIPDRLIGAVVNNCRDQRCDCQRKNGIHVVPELPLGEDLLHRSLATNSADKPVKEGIEVVVQHNKGRLAGVLASPAGFVMPLKLPHHLKLEGCLTRTLLAKDNRRAGVFRVSVDFIPSGMKG